MTGVDLLFLVRQCDTYLRLARENVAQEEADMNRTEIEYDDLDAEEDKTYAAMGVSKTLSTVRGLKRPMAPVSPHVFVVGHPVC